MPEGQLSLEERRALLRSGRGVSPKASGYCKKELAMPIYSGGGANCCSSATNALGSFSGVCQRNTCRINIYYPRWRAARELGYTAAHHHWQFLPTTPPPSRLGMTGESYRTTHAGIAESALSENSRNRLCPDAVWERSAACVCLFGREKKPQT